jgi:hypothetical protein
MNNNLKNLLYISVSLFLLLNYILPQNKTNRRINNKTAILKNKIEYINHIDKDKLNKIYTEKNAMYKNINKYFYNQNSSKTKNMTSMQRSIENIIKKIPISDYKVKWLNTSEENKLNMKLVLKCDVYEFKKLIEGLKNLDKIMKIDDLRITQLGGRYKHKKVLVTFIVNSFRIKK